MSDIIILWLSKCGLDFWLFLGGQLQLQCTPPRNGSCYRFCTKSAKKRGEGQTDGTSASLPPKEWALSEFGQHSPWRVATGGARQCNLRTSQELTRKCGLIFTLCGTQMTKTCWAWYWHSGHTIPLWQLRQFWVPLCFRRFTKVLLMLQYSTHNPQTPPTTLTKQSLQRWKPPGAKQWCPLSSWAGQWCH